MANSDQTIETPWDFVGAVSKLFGIELLYDMACTLENRKAVHGFTEDQDSLNIDWPLDGWCWVNPPFNNLGKWIAKMREQQLRGCKIISVFPLSSDQNRDPAWLYSNVHMIHGHRLWTEVRSLMLCEWRLDYHSGPKSLRWDRDAGTLIKGVK